jgi:tricorn protease
MPRTPDIHGDRIVFSAEGDLWLGSLSGGTAERITNGRGLDINPRFSPDGKWIAFTGGYDGTEVYVMSVEGGTPRRLTFDTTKSEMVCWTPDGKSILFRSARASGTSNPRLYLVSVDGSLPKPLPMEKGAQASYSADGASLVYTRLPLERHRWKRYHGGEANSIWIANLANKKFHRIDADTVNEQYPVWVGSAIYYVSERDGTANLWRYDTHSGGERRITSHGDYDVVAPASDGKKVIYEWGNDLYTYDVATGKDEPVKLKLISDMIHARPYAAPGTVGAFAVGPTGKRIVVLGRGQLYSAPAENGDIRPISNVLGSRSKEPSWSPDGKWVAFISDRSGEENLWVTPASGDGDARQVTSESRTILDDPVWSPDSSQILYRDFSQTTYLINVSTGVKQKIDQSDWSDITDSAFSPDGKWIAYSRAEGVVLKSLYLYNVASKKSTRLTFAPTIDGFPAWDPAGKYLFFLSNRSLTAKPDDFDFQMDFLNTTKAYAIVLSKDSQAPISAEDDEEPGSLPSAKSNAKPAKKDDDDGDDAKPKDTKIDFEGIGDRIVELPIANGNLSNLKASSGSVLYTSTDDDGTTLKSLDFKTKKETTLGSNVQSFQLTGDCKKMAVLSGQTLQIVDTGASLGSDGKVDLSSWKVEVDPRAEWKQEFLQAWRQHRDVFYDPNIHGMNWENVRKKYEALLPSVGSRAELTELIGNMQGEVNVSHEFVGGGGDRNTNPPAPGVGSLGADLAYDQAARAYKFTHMLHGDGFDANSKSPLLAPGVAVSEGDYLLAINGTTLRPDHDPNEFLVGEGGRVVRLLVNSKPTAEGARTVRVKAMTSDRRARYYDWVGSNRAYVTKFGGANIGYVHVPDMENDGMQEFTKHFYANLDKDGIVIDVRYNHGGNTSGQILERLRRVIFEFDQGRYGAPQPYHRLGYLGHVVVLCNEETSSDGEYFCTGFRYEKLGPTVGTRTWGGFMAVGTFSTLDGGYVTTPVDGSFSPDGKWLPDGTGFTPDYIVEEDPNAFVAGRDPQMDKALELLKAEIKIDPPKWPKRLAPPSKLKAFGPNRK